MISTIKINMKVDLITEEKNRKKTKNKNLLSFILNYKFSLNYGQV